MSLHSSEQTSQHIHYEGSYNSKFTKFYHYDISPFFPGLESFILWPTFHLQRHKQTDMSMCDFFFVLFCFLDKILKVLGSWKVSVTVLLLRYLSMLKNKQTKCLHAENCPKSIYTVLEFRPTLDHLQTRTFNWYKMLYKFKADIFWSGCNNSPQFLRNEVKYGFPRKFHVVGFFFNTKDRFLDILDT